MSLLEQLIASITPDAERFTRHKFDIADTVMFHLQKDGKKQKDLAELLGKSESEISKWLSGQHNLTLRSIARMEAELGVEIIKVQVPKLITDNLPTTAYAKTDKYYNLPCESQITIHNKTSSNLVSYGSAV
jgi:predicted transcriptional regulator